VSYDGAVQKVVWRRDGEDAALIPRPDRHGKKRMLCIFWSMYGPVHWELLPPRTSVNSALYINQLSIVNQTIQLWRAGGHWQGPLIFHHDNAPPHHSYATINYINTELHWTVLPHPPYSPDIAPSDYHLFKSLKNFLRGRRFTEDAEVEQAVRDYLTTKMNTNFFRKGIRQLPSRWRKVVETHGNYFVE